MRYVIIGASAAGCKAAETLRATPPTAPSPSSAKKPNPCTAGPCDVCLERRGRAGEGLAQGRGLFPAVEPRAGSWGAGRPGRPSRPRRAPPGREGSPLRPPAHRLGGPAPPFGPQGEELTGVYTLRTLADWQRLAAGSAPDRPGSGGGGWRRGSEDRRRPGPARPNRHPGSPGGPNPCPGSWTLPPRPCCTRPQPGWGSRLFTMPGPRPSGARRDGFEPLPSTTAGTPPARRCSFPSG